MLTAETAAREAHFAIRAENEPQVSLHSGRKMWSDAQVIHPFSTHFLLKTSIWSSQSGAPGPRTSGYWLCKAATTEGCQ